MTEAVPWLLLHYPDLNWEWLVEQTKRHNLQNRLGFLTTLARELAEKRKDSVATHTLRRWECVLDDARLAKTDTLARRLTTAERKFFTDHRSPAATHWNLLTSLQASDLGDEAT